MKNTRKWMIIIIPVSIILLTLIWYKSFYTSKLVHSDIVKLAGSFSIHNAQVRGVRFADAGIIVSASVDSTVQIWKKNGELLRTIKNKGPIASMDVWNDLIVTGDYDAMVRIWRLSDGELIKEMKGHDRTVWTIAISPDGKTIASSGEDAGIYVWDIASGSHKVLKGHGRTVWSVRFSPDGNTLASASFDATIKLWNPGTGELKQTLAGHTEAVVDVAFSRNGELLASTGDDGAIKLWLVPEGKLLRSIEVLEHVQAAVFSPDDKYLLTAGRDKSSVGELFQNFLGDGVVNEGVSMRLWEVATGKLLKTFTEHDNDVNDVDWSDDGWIVSGSEDNTVRLWRVSR